MWYPLVKKENYPPEISGKTLKKLTKNKDKFKADQGTVFHKAENGLLEVFKLTSQYVKTVLRYYCDLGHTQSCNFYLFLQDKIWWPNMLQDIKDILKHCETCKKHTTTLLPSKSVIPYDNVNPMNKGQLMS